MTTEEVYRAYRVHLDDPESIPAWHELSANMRYAWDQSVGKLVRANDALKLAMTQIGEGDDAVDALPMDQREVYQAPESPRASARSRIPTITIEGSVVPADELPPPRKGRGKKRG